MDGLVRVAGAFPAGRGAARKQQRCQGKEKASSR